MSGMYGNSRRSRTRSPVDDYLKKSLLAKVNKSELKLLRVAIKRGDGGGGGPHLPLERSIDDPLRICSYVHYRKDEDKKPKPPIFGRGIKVNQDFTENRRVFTHETTRANKSRSRSKRRSRSRSSIRNRRSRSAIRNKRSKSSSRNRSRSRKRSRNTHLRSRSRERSRSKSKRHRSRSQSRYRSRSRERRYSSDRRKHKDNDHYYSSKRSRYSRSSSRSVSPHEHKPDCPLYKMDENRQKKSLTPLRPGEYRPGHPDLALRSKRNSKRSRSRSYDGGSRSKRSQSLDNLPSTSRDRSSTERHYDSSKSSRKYHSPIKSEKKERQFKSRLSPDHYKRPRHTGLHEEYGYFEGWVPGPRLPTGRGGGFAIQPFYPPPFYPRGMMPGPLMHPGLMMHRMPNMAPFGPYRPHLPIYNSGAVRQRGPRPDKPATITISEHKEDDSSVVITEETSQNGDESEKSLRQSEHKDNENDERKEEQIDETKE